MYWNKFPFFNNLFIGSEESSSSSSSSSSEEEKTPANNKRRAARNVSYNLKEYDETIKAALAEEEQVKAEYTAATQAATRIAGKEPRTAGKEPRRTIGKGMDDDDDEDEDDKESDTEDRKRNVKSGQGRGKDMGNHSDEDEEKEKKGMYKKIFFKSLMVMISGMIGFWITEEYSLILFVFYFRTDIFTQKSYKSGPPNYTLGPKWGWLVWFISLYLLSKSYKSYVN